MMNTLGLLFHIHLCILNVYDRELYTFEYLDESSGWVCVGNSLNSTRAVHFVSYYNYIINKVMFGNNLRSTLSRPTFIAWFFSILLFKYNLHSASIFADMVNSGKFKICELDG